MGVAQVVASQMSQMISTAMTTNGSEPCSPLSTQLGTLRRRHVGVDDVDRSGNLAGGRVHDGGGTHCRAGNLRRAVTALDAFV